MPDKLEAVHLSPKRRVADPDVMLLQCFPAEITSFSEKSDVVGDVSADMAASAIVSGDSGEDTVEKGDGKLSLRMKLVTPVEEVSSERFSLQSKSRVQAVPHTSMPNASCIFLDSYKMVSVVMLHQ